MVEMILLAPRVQLRCQGIQEHVNKIQVYWKKLFHRTETQPTPETMWHLMPAISELLAESLADKVFSPAASAHLQQASIT